LLLRALVALLGLLGLLLGLAALVALLLLLGFVLGTAHESDVPGARTRNHRLTGFADAKRVRAPLGRTRRAADHRRAGCRRRSPHVPVVDRAVRDRGPLARPWRAEGARLRAALGLCRGARGSRADPDPVPRRTRGRGGDAAEGVASAAAQARA